MLDVWLPTADAASAAVAESKSKPEFWTAVTAAADNGAAATATMVSGKGRATHVRERSMGDLDPGAISAAALIKAMSKTC